MAIRRFTQHQPIPPRAKTIEELDRQRIHDQRILQDNVGKVLDELTNKPQLDTVLLEDLALTTSETLIEHKLNRTIRGWRICRINGNATVWDTIDTTTADLSRYLPLKASSAVTVSIEVF